MTLSLKGGELYYVTLNEETIITKESEIELTLAKGINNLNVKTNKDCQGTYKETFVVNNQPLVYPNPVKGNTLFINGGDLSNTSTPVEIYNLTGKLLFSKTYQATANHLKIDISNIPSGVFMLKVVTTEKTFNYKIIK